MAIFFNRKDKIDDTEEMINLNEGSKIEPGFNLITPKENDEVVTLLKDKINLYERERNLLLNQIEGLNSTLSSYKNNLNHSKEVIQTLENLKSERFNLIQSLKDSNLKYDELNLKFQEFKATSLSPNQVIIMEKSLRAARDENLNLKEKLSHYQEVGNQIMKIEVEEVPKEFSSSAIFLDNFKYKITVEDFFSGVKFKVIRPFLLDLNMTFINDIEDLSSIPNITSCKDYDLALAKFNRFKRNVVSFDDKVFLCKGGRVTKILKSYKKLLGYLNENNIEFMDDLSEVDIINLCGKANIITKSIKGILTTVEAYFETYKIGG